MAGFLFNLSPDRVNVPRRDWSSIDDLAGRYQARKANDAAGAAAEQYAGGLRPDQIAQVTPLLKNPELRAQGLRQIQEWRKPREFDVQIAPDGTPLRIDEQAGTIEAIGRQGQYARPLAADLGITRDNLEAQNRAKLAEANGLVPGSAEFQRYVLTGSLPAADRGVTAGDREAIRDADDAILSGTNTLSLLEKATGLSAKAYEGPTASLRGKVTGALGDEAGVATLELNNVVTEQALGQLKSMFGAAPTEGERQILLDIQGSADQPKAVRDAIFQRARDLVERKLTYNRERADELRGGTYYRPRTTPDAPTAPKAGASEDGWIFRGGDPKDQKNWIKDPRAK